MSHRSAAGLDINSDGRQSKGVTTDRQGRHPGSVTTYKGDGRHPRSERGSGMQKKEKEITESVSFNRICTPPFQPPEEKRKCLHVGEELLCANADI